ncbi:hypothetical protein JTE90_014390 [Oedothorax gibbosus]|uniref:Uncharacterized protein n=1 Tax=Oedothorax gibbosus TaxID=931172 RepID=A0AAV6V358_9ARAC|nr:hypothetical protein JTE90_014390 [Oedothorax gibbosus]
MNVDKRPTSPDVAKVVKCCPRPLSIGRVRRIDPHIGLCAEKGRICHVNSMGDMSLFHAQLGVIRLTCPRVGLTPSFDVFEGVLLVL